MVQQDLFHGLRVANKRHIYCQGCGSGVKLYPELEVRRRPPYPKPIIPDGWHKAGGKWFCSSCITKRMQGG